MREPGPHQGVIPFPRIDRWLLRTPSQRLQPSGQVVRMVGHTECDQNHRTEAQERPPIGVKASLEGTLFHDRQHTLPLLNPQASGRPEMERVCKLAMSPWCCRSCRAHLLTAMRLTPSRRAMSA
jgi:hypothetical protein